jgi:NADP-dependent 3-hydroxy acid dehydrogenase YdfG
MPLNAGVRLLKRIRACNRKHISKTGDLNVSDVADLIEHALRHQVNHRGILLCLSEYIATAVDGGTIDLDTWRPLARLRKREPRE